MAIATRGALAQALFDVLNIQTTSTGQFLTPEVLTLSRQLLRTWASLTALVAAGTALTRSPPEVKRLR